MNKVIFIAIILLILGIGGIVWGISDNTTNTAKIQALTEKEQPNWQDENARAMYFYSPDCPWCEKQKPILVELGQEDEKYRWKPMDVKEHQEYWEDYQIGGTPEFIDSKTGNRLEGYKEKEILKEWMDGLE